MSFSYDDLKTAVDEDAAFRRRRRLQPAGGPGDKLFPPTYPGEGRNAQPRHVFERRWIDGTERWCVLLDSVQSQANRLEEALLDAARAGRIDLPRLGVDFASAGINSLGEITSLDAPHRVFDAILRDSQLEGQPFQKTDLYDRMRKATGKDASALLEISPTALLFGVWNSTGEGGGLGAKFARAIVSEIIGVDVPVEDGPVDRQTGEVEVVTAGRRTGSRIDPVGISVKTVTIYQRKDDPSDWTGKEEEAAKDKDGKPIKFVRKDGSKAGKPAVINHGNVRPSVDKLGVTCAYAEHTAVITLAGLRRLRFGGPPERDSAGRCLLAALGLVALTEQDRQGYALRSRCDLVCEDAGVLQKVAFDGTCTPLGLNRDEAAALYAQACRKAGEAGFTLDPRPVRLTPQGKLVHIVRESMNRALNDEGEGGGDDDVGP